MKTIKVNVEQVDVEKGKRGGSKTCMIALAIKRAYPQMKNVVVEERNIAMTDTKRNERLRFPTPIEARVMILKYDSGEEIAPFRVQCRRPDVHSVIRGKKGERKTMLGERQVQEKNRKKGANATMQVKDPAARMRIGRDRVFGAKMMADKLAFVRQQLGVGPILSPAPSAL